MDPLFPLDEPHFGKRKKWPQKWPQKWKAILGGVIVVALLGWTGVSLFFKIKFGDFQPPFSAPAVIISIVETKTIQDKIEAVGTTEASNSATITATVTEIITSLPAEDGAVVSKGNVIAVLNDQAERANVAEASEAYKRYNQLADMKIASEARREQEQARLDVANAALNERVIRAPFDGVLGLIEVNVGDVVSPGMVITTIDDINPLEVEFSIPENQIANIAIEMPVTTTTEAYSGESFAGKITAINTRIDPQTRALRVKASINNDDGRLKPGMLLKTNIIKAVRPAMILPEGTILSKGDQKSVLIVGKNDKKEDVAIEKMVTLGTRQSGFVEIVSGLSNGDKVIVEGQLKAEPDTQVKVTETKSIDELTKAALDFSVTRKQEALKAEAVTDAKIETPIVETPVTETSVVKDDTAP